MTDATARTFPTVAQMRDNSLTGVVRYEIDRVVVGKGLNRGDIVVTAGVNRLHDRQKVRLQEGVSE